MRCASAFTPTGWHSLRNFFVGFVKPKRLKPEVLFPWGRPGLAYFHDAVLASAFQMGWSLSFRLDTKGAVSVRLLTYMGLVPF